MIDWHSLLNDKLCPVVRGDTFWEHCLDQLRSKHVCTRNLHLAILVEPYLEYVLMGRKTLESRFSVNRCAPYQRVREGDVLLLKRSGGPIVGLAEVGETSFYQLDARKRRELRDAYTVALCAEDPEFWNERSKASFATIMKLRRVREISPVTCEKRDRRGWIVLREDQQMFGTYD